ncbi:hypothetical protein IAR55_002169 [Kwoniella newhampshirensis]|uniref:MHYT domain-containing protein n=1 Tax=Kwoniella newhampshirensis TaxID=1651941 RepID=A0AAW0YQ59_9TREE
MLQHPSASSEDEQPRASTSRRSHLASTPPSVPSSPSQRSLRSARRKISRSTIFLILSLGSPSIAAANPLPHPHHRPRLRLLSASDKLPSMSTAFHDIFSTAIRIPASLISRRNTDDTAIQPIIGIATFDQVSETYRVPDGYVVLNQHFDAGFIVLSYVIAFVGSLCTLELLVRRTTNTGWRNQALLTAAGICFGAVSTFAMHFVFNNALSLHHPMMDQGSYPALYLAYNAGYTVLSLVVSCLAMTMAFFVMGTKLKDWVMLGSSKKKRANQRRRSSGGANRADADDYRTWKSTHRKVMRRGTMGVGALFAQAGSVAKWSMMDTDGGTDQSKIGGKSPKYDFSAGALQSNAPYALNDDDKLIAEDKTLQELQFRLGTEAVKEEISRRVGGSMSTSPSDSRRPSINLSASGHPTPSVPLPVTYPPSSRRASLATTMPDSHHALFTPGFNFPARSDTTTNPTPSSGPPLLMDSSFGEEAPPYQYDRRRASFPANVLSAHRSDRPSYSGPTTLARIQSLSEGDIDTSIPGSASPSSPSSEEKHFPSGTPRTAMDQLSSLSEKDGVSSKRSSKKVRLIGRSTTLTRIGMFLGFDVVTPAEIAKIFITGITAGFGVVGMHYIGQASITGIPYVAYDAGYVVGSVIIACGAVVIALYIMFIMLRPKLKHTWFSKICVALILAVAVCAMHLCGMMGTTYAWPAERRITKHNKLTGTNAAITGVVAALAFTACIGCAVFFVLHSLNNRRERARRRRVVVASVLLDDRDRVLVNSTDGMLPMCDIASLTGGELPSTARSFSQSMSSESTVLGMDLTIGHDAFVSAMKLTWSWRNPSMSPIHQVMTNDSKIPKTDESALAATLADIRRGSMITANTATTTTGSRPTSLSITKFLEKFATSSCQLAVRLTGEMDGIQRLGVLYDQILTTGWVKLTNSNDTVSKGQLIFLVRRVVSAAERSDLESRHFIFADPQAVAGALHKTLSVPLDHTIPLLEDMGTFCDSTLRPELQSGKLYGGVAVVQATPFDGLRVLLEKDKRSQLPMREMCTLGLQSTNHDELSGSVEQIGETLALLEGMTMLSIITRNIQFDTNDVMTRRVAALLSALERAIVPMLDEMLTAEDMAHILPRLTLHPLLVPLTPGGSKRPALTSYTPPYAVIFYANYDAAVNTFTDKWLPFSLFRAQNACVMAPKIAAAAKMDKLYTVETSGDNGFIDTRRPSKVQFDFPVSASPMVPTASSHHQYGGTADANGMFGGFTFPPKSDNGHGDQTTPNTGVPRRSSLARSRLGSMSGESIAPSAEGGGLWAGKDLVIGQGSPGVGVWDQDWLLHLLRTKLRTEA